MQPQRKTLALPTHVSLTFIESGAHRSETDAGGATVKSRCIIQ